VAEWYDDLLEGPRGSRRGERAPGRRDEGSDLHHQVILPGTLRLLALRSGQRVLDLACGQGLLARSIAGQGASVVGIDASSKLIDSARRAGEGNPRLHFDIGDVRAIDLAALGGPSSFDAITCVMAMMNIDPLEPMVAAAGQLLRPGGRFVAVILHPAFRAPGQTAWGWTGEGGATRAGPPPRVVRTRDGQKSPVTAPESRQFRRVDAYLSPARREIVMNPGAAADGRQAVTTTTHHRPIQTYVGLLASAGLLIDAIEEWTSPRRSAPGPGAEEENRIRREIPMFLAIRAVRAPQPREGAAGGN